MIFWKMETVLENTSFFIDFVIFFVQVGIFIFTLQFLVILKLYICTNLFTFLTRGKVSYEMKVRFSFF